jgi:KaiC/GvpD/RAD55 family RecA-like ATPase
MSVPGIQAPLLTQKVVLDGQATSPDEWSDTVGTVISNRCLGKNCSGFSPPVPLLANITIWAKHDGRTIYFLFQVPWPLSLKQSGDSAGFEYHWSQTGLPPWEHADEFSTSEDDQGQDWVFVKSHNTVDDSSSRKLDVDVGCKNNIDGREYYDGRNWWFEFRKPLDSGDPCDVTFKVDNRYGAEGIDGLLRPYFWNKKTTVWYPGFVTMSILSSQTVTTSVIMTPILSTGTTTTTSSTSFQFSSQATSPALSLGGIPLFNPYLLGGLAAVITISSVALFARRKKAMPKTAVVTQPQEPAPTLLTSSTEPGTEPPIISTKFPPPAITPERKGEPSQVRAAGGVISSGYAELDGLLAGGFPERYAVLFASPSYDERDLILHKIIETNLSSNTPTYYVSGDVRKTEDLLTKYPQNFYALCSQADKITPAPAGLYKIGGVENLSDFNISVSTTVRSIPVQQGLRKIMIIDTLSDVVLHHKLLTTRRWLSDFLTKRKVDGFTVFATFNPLIAAREEVQTILDSFDGVIEIFEKELKERSRRFLVIRKMYGRKYSESELMLDKDKLF